MSKVEHVLKNYPVLLEIVKILEEKAVVSINEFSYDSAIIFNVNEKING